MSGGRPFSGEQDQIGATIAPPLEREGADDRGANLDFFYKNTFDHPSFSVEPHSTKADESASRRQVCGIAHAPRRNWTAPMTVTKDISEESIEVDDAFTYETLPPAQASEVQRAAETINQHVRTTGVDVLLVGRELCHVKRLLGRGLFGSWLRHEVKLGERTGRRYRRVHERLGAFADTVSVLSPSDLYILSAAPPAVIDEIVDQMRHGIPVHIEGTLGEGKNIPKRVSRKSSQGEPVRLTAETEKVDAAGPQLIGPTEVEIAALDELALLMLDRFSDLATHIVELLNTVGYIELSARLRKHEENRADLSAPALLLLMSSGAKVLTVQDIGRMTVAQFKAI